MGTRQQLAKVNIESMRVGDSTTTPASDVKNLGTWFDRQLRWTHTLITVVKPLFSHLYNIRRFRKFPQSWLIVLILVNASVTSLLDYCNSLLYGLPTNLLHKLQRVQNAAARLICKVRRFDHITPILFSLHWLPVRNRIQFKILLFTYKALNGLAPAYITELLKLKTIPRYNLRSSDDKLLLQHPNIRTLVTLGDRSFTAAAPKLWNDLTCGHPPCH